jgi:crotonobetainyl-CoA:carnitine CoA-transferase CaiB-like acyl-CoA transferase
MDEVFADPQVEHLAMTEPVEHPALGRLDILRNAVRMTGARPPSGRRARTPATTPARYSPNWVTRARRSTGSARGE